MKIAVRKACQGDRYWVQQPCVVAYRYPGVLGMCSTFDHGSGRRCHGGWSKIGIVCDWGDEILFARYDVERHKVLEDNAGAHALAETPDTLAEQ